MTSKTVSTPHSDVRTSRHSSRNFIACTVPVTLLPGLYVAVAVAFHTILYHSCCERAERTVCLGKKFASFNDL